MDAATITTARRSNFTHPIISCFSELRRIACSDPLVVSTGDGTRPTPRKEESIRYGVAVETPGVETNANKQNLLNKSGAPKSQGRPARLLFCGPPAKAH
jgi:hypothetical protein